MSTVLGASISKVDTLYLVHFILYTCMQITYASNRMELHTYIEHIPDYQNTL